VLEYLAYMLMPTLASAFLLYILGIRRFRLEKELKKAAPFIIGLSTFMYFGGEIGTCLLKPWFFDCDKTIGFCPCGLPVEDALFSVLIVLNITMATVVFSDIERRSRNRWEFLENLLTLRKP